jgi:3-phenylpropionate/cinnamic acid dioxygenase small subunit
MGTGWGDEMDHSVSQVEFQRKTPETPTEIISIYYDSRKGLENRGIQVVLPYKKETSQLPNPFPEYVSGMKTPPGWNGAKKRS